MLADDLSDYLFARSTGTIGSLMDLIRRGASSAMRTGVEQIDQELLDEIRIDEAAETNRAELTAVLRRGRERATNPSRSLVQVNNTRRRGADSIVCMPNRLRVHWSGRMGAGAPTLVLLHGITNSGAGWVDAVRRWSGAYRIAAFDALGHGASDRFTDEELAGEGAEAGRARSRRS